MSIHCSIVRSIIKCIFNCGTNIRIETNLIMIFKQASQKNFNLLCLLLALALLVGVPTKSAFAVDPDIKWRVLETNHFKVVYDSRHYPLAQKYALFAEQSYVTLVPVFKEAPRKTTLVLNDSTDLANGYATNVPYPLIMLYPVLPGSLDTISDYGNWGLELVTHEYVHTLNVEPSNGIFKPLRLVFGAIMRPNMLLPRWYLEGLAVQLETQYSSFGRLRSANYLAIARAMVEQGTLRKEDIARINESTIPDWPGGARPYLLGALVWNELIKLTSSETIYTLNQKYSRRIPFAIDGPLIEVARMDYATLLDKTYATTETNSNRQIDAIKASGETSHEKVKQEGQFSHSPVISPDGKKLLYVGNNYRNEEVIQFAERREKESFVGIESKTLVKGDSIQKVSWLPDSQSFVFDKVDEFNYHYEFSDLYRYDFNSKKAKRLTKGLRAKEPVVTNDGERIFFVQNVNSTARLASVDKNGQDLQVHHEPPLQGRVARPEFIRPGEIVFTLKLDDGKEELILLNLETKVSKKLFTELSPVHFPRMTSQGLTFVSDKSGVANVMIANSTLSSARPLTNVTTRAMTAEYDVQAEEYLYSHLYAEGPQLVRMSLADSKKAPAQLPQVGSLVDYQWKQHTPPEVDAKYEEKDYSVWPYLIPRYWMPWFYLSSNSNFFSASTSAGDPLGKHAYSLSAYYDSYPGKPGFSGSYINQTTDLIFSLDAIDEYDRLSATTLRHSTAGVVSAAGYLPWLSNSWTGGLGWRYDQTQYANRRPRVRNGPQIFFTYKDYSQKGIEISPESGGALKVAYTKFLEGVGNIAYDRIDINGRYYHSKWLPKRHVLAPSIRATIEPGLKDILLGTSSISNGQIESTLNARHVMRGYDPSIFIGRNMISSSLEYRFPVANTYQGAGTTPIFIKRWHGALLADAITMDGVYYDNKLDAYPQTRIGGRMFMSAGAEVRADATIGYHLPITFSLGMYYAFDDRAGTRSPVPFIGFQM